MFLEVAVCLGMVVGAEVRADTVGCFRRAVVQRRGRAGVAMGAGGAVEIFIFCVEVVFGKLWVLLHKTPELVCETTTGGRQRWRKKTTSLIQGNTLSHLCSSKA